MVFKRRNKLGLFRRIREWVMPRTGWRRALTYLGHRIKRLPDSSDRISRGIAFGVFISFTPLFGFHIIIALLMAKLFRGNVISALLGTAIGNPFTFPFIAVMAMGIGKRLVGARDTDHEFGGIRHAFGEAAIGIKSTVKSWFGYGESELDRLVVFWNDVFFPYFIGGLIPGLTLSIASFYLSRPVIHAYQSLRRKKMLENRKKNGNNQPK